MQPLQRQTFSNGRLEVITVEVTLPWHGILSLSTVYRSPSLSLDNLLTFLDTFLSTLPSDMPTVIVGDFNENLRLRSDTKLLQYMHTHKFTQHVQQPTTDRGTLIDHIYINTETPIKVHIKVLDTYYSDHDCVLLSLST